MMIKKVNFVLFFCRFFKVYLIYHQYITFSKKKRKEKEKEKEKKKKGRKKGVTECHVTQS